MAIFRGPNIVRSGLVLALDAADKNSYPGTGTNWYDISGNGNNGTITSGEYVASPNGGYLRNQGNVSNFFYIDIVNLQYLLNNIHLHYYHL